MLEQLGQVLRIAPSRIAPDATFASLGVDSLMGLEMRNRLENRLGVRLQATLLFTFPTTAALIPHLLRLEPTAEPVRQATAGAADGDRATGDRATGGRATDRVPAHGMPADPLPRDPLLLDPLLDPLPADPLLDPLPADLLSANQDIHTRRPARRRRGRR